MSTPVEQIKERLNIEDLVGSYIKLEKAGKNLKARCPFHNEKSPSFFVSPERNSYYCFGCGAKGDIFTFVQEFEGLDFFGALKLLAERTGVTLERGLIDKKDNKEIIFTALEAAVQYFEGNMPHAKEAIAYLNKRGLIAETISQWRIGYVSDDWRNLYEYLKSRKFTDEQIESAGLIKRSENNYSSSQASVYDRFRGRIMFPIRDSAGRVVGFTGRILPQNDDGKAAKYLNSPETAVFNKSKLLYGFDFAKTAIKKFGYSVVVEGQMDLLMCHQSGFDNTVATSGTALTPEHLQLLKRISNKVIMAFDGDKAGMNAAVKAWILALSLGMEVKVAELASGVDPADLILSDKEKWKEVLKQSMHIVDFQLLKLIGEKLDDRKMGLAIIEKVLPFVALIESTIEKSHFISKISSKTGIKEEALWDDLKRVKVLPGTEGAETKIISFEKKERVTRITSLEKQILGVISWLSGVADKKQELKHFREEIISLAGSSILDKIESYAEDVKNEAAFEAEQYFDKRDLKQVFSDILSELEKETLKNKFNEVMQKLSKAEKDKNIKLRDDLLVECNEITKKMAKIKNKI